MSDDFKTLQSRVNSRIGEGFKPTQAPTNAYDAAVFMWEVLEWAKDVEDRLQASAPPTKSS